MPGTKTLSVYALAMGSNRALSARMTPRLLLSIALEAVAREIGPILAVSPILDTAPIGPSRRRYANNALLVESTLSPPAMLAALQTIETRFGRRRSRRWAARTLDIDIILWSGGTFTARDLVIPHCSFTVRDFVLAPLACIAPAWRDPRSGLTVAHLRARLQKRRQKPLRKG